MFDFLSIFNRKKKKNANDAKKADQGCSNERKKISVAYKILLLGGFAMLLLSMIYGGLYGCLFRERVHENRDIQLKIAIHSAGIGDMDKATQSFEQMKDTEALAAAVRSSHSHLALFGLIAISIAGYFDKIKLYEIIRVTAAIALIAGGLLLPLGVMFQPLLGKNYFSCRRQYGYAWRSYLYVGCSEVLPGNIKNNNRTFLRAGSGC